MIEIVWPEIRPVPDSQIEEWFTIAVARGMIPPNKPFPKTAVDMALALDNAGIICLKVNNRFDIIKE